MTKVDDIFERVVDVHSVKISKPDLEEMFKKCGPVTHLFHWKGNHDKPHMLVEYASLSSAKSARAMSNDKSGLQVIRAYNNDGLIRKFKELCRSHVSIKARTPQRAKSPPKGPRNRSPSRSPANYRRTYSNFKRPRSLSPRRDPGVSSQKSGRRSRSPQLRRNESTLSANTAPSVPTWQSSTDKKDWSRWKDKDSELLTATPMSDNNNELPKQLNITAHSPPSSASILHIPYAGEVIQMDLRHQLEENPIGIITILTATEAAQKLWMMVAAHYNSQSNQTSARKVLEAGITLSIRLGRTDIRPLWYLLDQMNNPKAKTFSDLSPPDLRPALNAPLTNVANGINLTNDLINRYKERTLFAVPSRSSTEIPPETQSLINKLQTENKALRAKYSSLLDDLSDAKAGKRRAEDEIKEERSVRRKLERDLRETEDALKRSKRMEQTALDQFKTEVEFRRKAEVLLANVKAQPPPRSPNSQHSTLFQLISSIQGISPQKGTLLIRSDSSTRLNDTHISSNVNTLPPRSAQ